MLATVCSSGGRGCAFDPQRCERWITLPGAGGDRAKPWDRSGLIESSALVKRAKAGPHTKGACDAAWSRWINNRVESLVAGCSHPGPDALPTCVSARVVVCAFVWLRVCVCTPAERTRVSREVARGVGRLHKGGVSSWVNGNSTVTARPTDDVCIVWCRLMTGS